MQFAVAGHRSLQALKSTMLLHADDACHRKIFALITRLVRGQVIERR